MTWTRGPHRLEKQKLIAAPVYEGTGSWEAKLVWHTVRTEYRNGGELVEWDA